MLAGTGLVLKPTVLSAGDAAGKGLAGVGNAFVGVGLGCPKGVGVGWVNGFEGEADAEGVCPNPPPAPKVNEGVVAGAADALDPNPPLAPNPPPALLLAPNANGEGLAGAADPNPFDWVALAPFKGPPNGPVVVLDPFVALPNANPVEGCWPPKPVLNPGPLVTILVGSRVGLSSIAASPPDGGVAGRAGAGAPNVKPLLAGAADALGAPNANGLDAGF